MKRITASFVLVFFFHISFCQVDGLKKANEAFANDHFREALVYLNRLEKINSSAPLLFKRGICHYEINQLDNAMGDFQRAWEYGYENSEVDFYVGLIHHQKGNFELAASHYKRYLNDLEQDDIRRRRVIKLIKQCGKALDLLYLKPLAVIEKLPGTVNTAFDEIGLIESPGISSRFYFTSNKPNLSSSMEASDYDVYFVDQDQGAWQEANRMRYTINKRDNEVLLGFNRLADGLFFYRGKDYQGEVFSNVGFGDNSRTTLISLPLSLSMINSDVFFYDDDFVIFSSREGQGYGGYDLYASTFENGRWSEPENLGPNVNSEFDEISPYLTRDGSELYFSSDRDESIGGFDIFSSRYLFEADAWSQPANLGIPINSPGNDTHFSLSLDGLKGYFSSNRKDAFGGMDIFIARFKQKRGTQELATEEIAFNSYQIPEYDDVNSAEIHEDQLIDNLDSTYRAIGIEVFEQEPILTSFEILPLYYSEGSDLINERNRDQIDYLINIMMKYPELEIEFTAHTTEEAILEYKLYSSLKLAERLEKYFVEKGIQDDRIFIKGFADSYPLALPVEKGGDYKLADQFNSRIEFKFLNYNPEVLQFTRPIPDVPSHAASNRFDLLEALTEESITYKIQIAIVSQMYRGMALDLFNDAIVEEIEETGLYAYSIGLYDNYAEALAVKRKMDQLGITDAKVIAYYDGHRLKEDQYAYHVNEFPDLRNLMNYTD